MNEVIDVDLPSLRSITLGRDALSGIESESCSLTMRSKNDAIRTSII